MVKRIVISCIASLAMVSLAVSAYAADTKIAVVNIERIFRDAAPSVRAQKKIEREFEKRDRELQQMRKQLQSAQDNLEKNSVTMSESERRNKERELSDLSRDFQRRQREYSEDLNQRRNEELAVVLDRANKVIKQIADSDGYDIILQEAVYFSPRIDITDRIIKGLADTPVK